jgi:AraC-like DNA-binding protein
VANADREGLFADKVGHVLDEVFRHSGHGGFYHDLADSAACRVGHGAGRFCSGCTLNRQTAGFCRNDACAAAIQGHAIGDVWYFRCWLGFDSLALAIAPDGELRGSIEIGGFFSPGGTDEAQQTIFSRLNTLAPGILGQLPVGAIQGVRELNFERVKAIADFLMESAFAAGLSLPAQFQTRKRVFSQRERLARRVRELDRGMEPTHSELLRRLVPLAAAAKAEDPDLALGELDNYLGTILLRCEGQLDKAKASLVLLMATLFREDVEEGEQWKTAMHRFEERLIDIEQAESTEDAFIRVEDVVSQSVARSGGRRPDARRQDRLSDRLLAWLGENFSRRVTLAEAALAVAASPSAITHRLKGETGRTFSQHLAALRVSEAKRLLAYTDLSLTEVAEQCGFGDQSYFTKVFRRNVNMTPGEFRSMLDE